MRGLLTLTVNSTHFYLIDCQGGKLLVDAGWEMAQFTAQLKANQVPITAIRYILFTHHHPDHAGLVQAIRERSGAKLIIHEKQIPYLEDLRAFYAKRGIQNRIRVEKGDLVSPTRAAISAIGVQGEVVETPGHSPDSISLALDSGDAFIGDLPHPDFADPEQVETVRTSWRRLLDLGMRVFYHSHTDPIPAGRLQGI